MSLTSNELPDWKQLVLNRKEQLGSLQKVADELDYSRTSLSLALRDKYIGSTERLDRKSTRLNSCHLKLSRMPSSA